MISLEHIEVDVNEHHVMIYKRDELLKIKTYDDRLEALRALKYFKLLYDTVGIPCTILEEVDENDYLEYTEASELIKLRAE